MNDFKTLKELCELLNVTRRIVQGYEKKGLVHPDYRDKYGHLLYNDETINRIIKIRFYQKMGFKLQEIVDFIDLPDKEKEDILVSRLNILKIEQEIHNKKLMLIEKVINNLYEYDISKYLEIII